MNLIKARPVLPGQTIGIVAPAGPVPLAALTEGLDRLHRMGYKTLVGDAVLNQHGYLAGSDAARASDFNGVWANSDVDAVLCARGGYGTMRILELLDWELFRAQPKFFAGFSDITAIHIGMEVRAGLVTFHGPMGTAFGGAEAYNATGLIRAMQACDPLGTIPWPRADDISPPVVVQPGVVEGRLAGGNLSLITSLMGTPWALDFTDRIILLEDVEEPPYRIDRMLTQLILAGTLQRAAGILFSDSPSCMVGAPNRPSQTLLEVLEDRLRPLGIPVLYGFPGGHTAYRATLPLGVRCRLDAGEGGLTYLEAALA
jgi:muramoyltetrapeptide carboxypeptidase